MPWRESGPMDERLQFVRDAQRNLFTMSELCARYGVSRRVGYKWLARYEAEGRAGLLDRSHVPHHCPHKIPPAMEALLITARLAHPHWGARNLLAALARQHPRTRPWPAASTVADLLARRGLVQKRHPRRKPVHPGVVRPVTHAPNDLWTADFKGQFRTGDGRYCYPLTVADLHTRYLLRCHGLLSTQTVTARPIFERAFRVRTPARDPHRQWRPVRDPGDSRAVVPQRLVDAPRHSAPAQPSGVPAGQRGARTDAPHPEARGNQAGAGQLHGAAAKLRCLSARVLRGTSA